MYFIRYMEKVARALVRKNPELYALGPVLSRNKFTLPTFQYTNKPTYI